MKSRVPSGACLVVFATSVLLEQAVSTQAPAQPPAGGTAAPPAPPAGGRGGDAGRGGGRGALTPFAKEALAALRAPLDRLTPVTEAMLRNPSPGDWLHWRRTYDGWAHSPLTQINRDTVKDLKVAWTATNRYHLPIIDTCMGKMGDTPARFLAFDLQTMEFAWDIRTRVPQSSATLTTAGGLVFSATPDRYFRALDDRDGKVLWESPRLNDIPNAFPITYMVDGKQYIAMPVGNPGLQGNAALRTAPEHGTVRGASSSMLWVWQLP